MQNGKDTLIGQGVHFERIRRITGYLVGTLDRFNNAKRQEVQDRVKHCTCENGVSHIQAWETKIAKSA